MSALTRRQHFSRGTMSGFRSRTVTSCVRRLAAVLALALPAATWMIVAGAPAASASCSLNNHCWAYAYDLNDNDNYGAYGELYVNCLYQPNDGNFVTNEVWDTDSAFNYWEEVGIYSGANSDGGYGDRNWFWDDSRPGGGYHQHNSSTVASLNTIYRVEIVYAGNKTWYIYGNGNFSKFGTSVNQAAELTRAQAGTEYTAGESSGIRDQGTVYNVQRANTSYQWFNWGSNASTYYNGYIVPNYSSSQNFVTWTGPC
jgi:hypothetical protein